MILLIDGDCLIYKFAHAHQERSEVEIEHQGKTHTYVTWHAVLEPAIEDMLNYIEYLKQETECESHEIYFSDLGNNFRYSVGLPYKENRGMSERPLIWYHLRSYLLDSGAEVWDNLEGDDCLGIRATEEEIGSTCIATIDKDLRQIPGKYYNFYDEENAKVEDISVEEADRFIYFQVLAGDKIDGYGGCPGIGPVNANRILDEALMGVENTWDKEEIEVVYWHYIVKAYEKKGLSEEQAVMTYNLARILRDGDYNKDTGEVTLWSPTNE